MYMWKFTSVYAISVTQKFFVGRGTVSVPQRKTIMGNGKLNIVADLI